MPSSRSNSQCGSAAPSSRRCSLLARRETTPCMAGSCWSRKLRSRASSSASQRSAAAISSSNCGGVDLVAPFVLMGERLLRRGLHAVFRLGGVGHVLGLLGAHLGVGFLAFLAFGFGEFGWRRFRRPGWHPARSPSSFWPSAFSPSRVVVGAGSLSVSSPSVRWSAGWCGSGGRRPSGRAARRPACRDPCRRAPRSKGRHRSTALRGDSGGASPVSFSRTIRPSTSASGASSRARAPWPRPRAIRRCSRPAARLLAHALHRQRADGFDARLFGRFEHRGAVGRCGPELVVHLVVVIGLAQRIGIAGAAHDSATSCGGRLREGSGQARLQALAALAARRRN